MLNGKWDVEVNEETTTFGEGGSTTCTDCAEDNPNVSFAAKHENLQIASTKVPAYELGAAVAALTILGLALHNKYAQKKEDEVDVADDFEQLN